MKLGILAGEIGARVDLDMAMIKFAESLGVDSAWTREAWGGDAVSPAAWILAQTTKIKAGTAIMQMPARTPAATAMTAMSLAELSKGRFILGLGASGPQVVEGWHGVPFGRPLARLREYVQIVRAIIARESPVTFQGRVYTLPYQGEGATGLGTPFKTLLHCEHRIPIFSANITPAGVEAAAEVCDGFIPIWMDPERFEVFSEPLAAGFRKAGNKDLSSFEVSPFVKVAMGDDVEECMAPIRENMALYIGGMGPRKRNFYNDYARALGYEDAATRIQELFLSGKKAEAATAVPAELIDACHLVGPAGRIRERLHRWKQAGSRGEVATMILACDQREALELVARELL